MQPAYKPSPQPEPEPVAIIQFNELGLAGKAVALGLYPIPASLFLQMLRGVIHSMRDASQEAASLVEMVAYGLFGALILFAVAAAGYTVTNKVAKLSEEHVVQPARALAASFFTTRRRSILSVLMMATCAYWWAVDLGYLFRAVPLREILKEFPFAYPLFLICLGLSMALALVVAGCLDAVLAFGWNAFVVLITWRMEILVGMAVALPAFIAWDAWKGGLRPLVTIPFAFWLLLEIGYKVLPDRQAEDLRLAVSTFRFYRS